MIQKNTKVSFMKENGNFNYGYCIHTYKNKKITHHEKFMAAIYKNQDSFIPKLQEC